MVFKKNLKIKLSIDYPNDKCKLKSINLAASLSFDLMFFSCLCRCLHCRKMIYRHALNSKQGREATILECEKVRCMGRVSNLRIYEKLHAYIT